jgi:hypothetical protein
MGDFGEAVPCFEEVFDNLLKMRPMSMPITMPNVIANTPLAAAMSHPTRLPVYVIASMLIAGPVKRNVIAGPRPAPFFQIPAKSGSIVHEQTAIRSPAAEATG